MNAALASGVDLVVFDLPGFADRDGLYGQDGIDYPDNPERPRPRSLRGRAG